MLTGQGKIAMDLKGLGLPGDLVACSKDEQLWIKHTSTRPGTPLISENVSFPCSDRSTKIFHWIILI
jgi:hypothetical protein